MKYNRRTIGLYFISFGAIELALTSSFSGFIWLSYFVHNLILPTIINLSLLGITLIYSFWKFLYRMKARAYLSGLTLRIFFAGSVFVLYQIGFAPFVPKPTNYIWLAVSFVIYCYSAIQWFHKEKKVWELTLDILQKSGKLNVKKSFFRIRGGFYSATDKPSNPTKKGALAGYTIVVGLAVFKILEWYLGKDLMTTFFKIGLFFMNYLTGMLLGKIVLWTIEICKLEKKLGIEFVTEFGETEHPKIRDGKQNKL